MRRDGAANRERILLAAEHIFGTQGAAGSTEDVAREAQVGVATVFRHFPTKKELIEATAARYLEKVDAEARHLCDSAYPTQALASIVHTLVQTGATKVTLLNALLDDSRELTEPIIEAVQAIRHIVGLILAQGQDAGEVRSDVTVTDVFTLARALAHVATPDNNDAIDHAIAIVLDGLAVPGKPR